MSLTAQSAKRSIPLLALVAVAPLCVAQPIDRSLVGVQTTIATGSAADAQTYYRKLSAALRFQNPHTILDSDLDDLLKYCGYRGVFAADLERLDSDVLMDPTRLAAAVTSPDLFQASFNGRPLAPGEIVAARFFAPKISDVSSSGSAAFGWRKLVRLIPRAESAATTRGVNTVWLLFNFFERDLSKSPFSGRSVNTQGIVVTKGGTLDPVYWLDYEPLPIGRLGLSLDATFDARDPSIPSPEHVLGRPDRKYFVPHACAACHGNLKKPLLNYLDTDHWFDRAQIGDDFAPVSASIHGILFDGGKDSATPQFLAAFEVFRRLNREIDQQNRAAQPASSQARAAAKWLELHDGRTAHLLPIERAFRGGVSWTKGAALDEELLPLLNRYCYRCHGSVRFNVFDKEAVRDRASDCFVRLNADPASDPRIDPRVAMPPDRTLSPIEKQRLLSLFDSILKGK